MNHSENKLYPKMPEFFFLSFSGHSIRWALFCLPTHTNRDFHKKNLMIPDLCVLGSKGLINVVSKIFSWHITYLSQVKKT